ncbi:MAG: CHAT domain-containing protein [Acaryochloridaceae cyanobacterium CSU_5_19]|nr:CHAT domain-containing protein [Acaryochloridaceae cyanobacterium CSU_5_19]
MTWQQAVELYQRQGAPLNQAIALNHLTLAQQELGEWEAAQQNITQSLQLLAATSGRDQLPILAQAHNAQGSLLLAKGELENAIASWQTAATAYTQAGDETGHIGSLINQAQAQQMLGFNLQARRTLAQVKAQLKQHPDPELRATGLRSLGNVLRLTGDFKEAEDTLALSLEAAKTLASPQAMRVTQLSLGNLARTQQRYPEALAFYQQAAQSTLLATQLQAQLNQFGVWVDQKNWQPAQQLWPDLYNQLATQPLSRTQIYSQVNFIQTLMKLHQGSQQEAQQAGPTLTKIAQISATALQQARQLQDQQAIAYTLGTLGSIYEQTQQWSEAQKLTEQALVIAQRHNAPEISYRWQWQLGRILKAKGNITDARSAYQDAFKTLEYLRKDLVATHSEAQFSFRESVEPVYRQLVDLLLEDQAGFSPSQANLKQAREVIEALQLTELDDFFRSACLDGQVVSIDQIDQGSAAIIYPILLRDRMEVIVSLPQGKPIHHYTIPIGEKEIEAAVSNFRQLIERPYTDPLGKALGKTFYQWLIEPSLKSLQQADTLVFVLDGPLRNIPIAALYDGQKYLIEQYALALAPGMKLIKTQPLQGRKLEIIAAGVSEARLGFPALANVPRELAAIQSQSTSTVLLNQKFTKDALESQVRNSNFPIVHLATHGQFSSNAEETFVLAWDQPINAYQLNDLLRRSEQARQQPIELLVLSACQTAAGDQRAALGLAGVSVQAGARSTLASLWQIDDESSSALISHFYQHLAKQHLTKAQALRQAQRDLMTHPDYRHPAHWAAFVLVGNCF